MKDRGDKEKRLLMQKGALLKARKFFRSRNVTRANERRIRGAKDERREKDWAVLSANQKTA